MIENKLATQVIGLALDVHKSFGPGLLEPAYQESLYYCSHKAGLFVEKEVPMPLVFEDVYLECGYRIDLLVERKLVLEIESVDALNDVPLVQILTYADERI